MESPCFNCGGARFGCCVAEDGTECENYGWRIGRVPEKKKKKKEKEYSGDESSYFD